METKKLPDVSFDSIPKGGRSGLFLDDDPQPVKGIFFFLHEEDEVLRGKLLAGFHHPPEILGVGDPFLLSEPELTFFIEP
jgi:hypothetical protein